MFVFRIVVHIHVYLLDSFIVFADMAGKLGDQLFEDVKTSPVPGLKTLNIKDYVVSYREVCPGSAKLDVLLLHGMRFKSETWVAEPVWTLQLLEKLGYRAVALALPGYEESSKISIENDVYLSDVISALKLDRPAIISPSMSGGYSLPYLFKDPGTVSTRSRGYVPVAPVSTGSFIEQYKQAQIPTLIVYGENDATIGMTSLGHLRHLPDKTEAMLHGAGHACYMNKPKEFHEHLIKFLQGLEH